ncbi:MAG: peptidyl-prolyl cis-trans isomerase [Nitrosospira sp.]|nr:peptidyl-prolyl cis-trans isomerase [Nitrosospira sp.]MBI0413403.1 peptidyl-prolyl cis-trans isomerase [Nitrosospira sp.]
MHLLKHLAIGISFLLSISAFAAGPQVEIKTNLGTIHLELSPDKAPKSVENFLKYVKGGHYKSTVFHRVIPGFMIQGGGFDQSYREKPTMAPIQIESSNGLKNSIGTVAMARTSDPNSATAQFFINVSDNAFLNYTAPNDRGYGYTVFGKVIGGMDVINKIAATPTGAGGPFPGDVPKTPIIIEDVRLLSATDSAPVAGQITK